jgi:hypothetical protein
VAFDPLIQVHWPSLNFQRSLRTRGLLLRGAVVPPYNQRLPDGPVQEAAPSRDGGTQLVQSESATTVSWRFRPNGPFRLVALCASETCSVRGSPARYTGVDYPLRASMLNCGAAVTSLSLFIILAAGCGSSTPSSSTVPSASPSPSTKNRL